MMQVSGTQNIMNRRNLRSWVRAEYDIFLHYLRFLIKKTLDYTMGNPLAKFIHDGATLANKEKYQTGGVQIIEPIWRKTFCLCIGVINTSSGKDKDVAELFEGLIKKTTGYSMKSICNSSVQDVAARGVGTQLDLEGSDCSIHQGDKPGRSAIGLLVRSRKKIVVNPFEAGVSLYTKVHKMAAHFSYGTRRSKLHDIAQSIGGPMIRLNLDLSTTSVASI